ncbi:MAG: PDZ domain-containing protein, partial [Alphaproteobacteria bacterium]
SGPAREAGLQPGDVIVAVEGKPVSDPAAFKYRFGTRGIGGRARLEVIRDGRPLSVSIALKAPPEDPPRDARALKGRNPLSGARVANLSPALAEELSLNDELRGVVITGLQRGTPASNIGFLRVRDIVLEINGVRVRNTAQLAALLRKPAYRWSLTLMRNGRRLNIILGG